MALAGFLLLSLLVAAIGGAITASTVDGWYQTLAKPPFNPPDWLFGPVWTLLFVLMAVAAWRIWGSARGRARARALTLYGVQLGLNLAWSALFFGLQAIGLALLEVILLTAAVVGTTHQFWHIDRLAGALLLPYAAWVTFATLLNAAIWQLN